MTDTPEFCSLCGASFPPRDGEGVCPDWKWCQQRTALIARVRKERQERKKE